MSDTELIDYFEKVRGTLSCYWDDEQQHWKVCRHKTPNVFVTGPDLRTAVTRFAAKEAARAALI